MHEPLEVAGLPAGTLEDKELTLAFQGGDKGAYQAIHDRYETRVYRVCRRMLSNPHDAQEAAQESFLRVYQALGRFNGRYQLGAWITRITTNVCLDHIRARSRRPVDAVQLEVLDLDDDRHHDVEDPEAITIRRAESRRVRKTLAELPPLHRAAIVLRDFEGLSYAEVAVALQITECQVKALIHRARQNFKRSWTPLSIFLPWRLASRFKDVDHVSKDQVAQAAVTTAQVAPSCTSMLQQCGQYVGQHVATVVTAAVVGTAAGAAGHASTQPPKPEVIKEAAVDAADGGLGYSSTSAVLKTVQRQQKAKPSRSSVKASEPAPTATPSDPQPEALPSATPSEAPSPAPTSSDNPSPSSSPSPRASAAPVGAFMPAVGFDYGRPIAGRAPRSYSASVSCTKDVLTQRLETVVEDDDSPAVYPALLVLNWGNEAASQGKLSLEFTVWKNGHEVYYSGTGDLTDGSYESGRRTMRFVGNYGTFNAQAKNMDMPESGRFSAGLTLDCAALSVITESVVLGA